MARVRDMQGVPAHIEVLKSDGHRRHPAHCIFHEGTGKSRVCTNPQNTTFYYEHCTSAKYCDYYEEEEK